MALPLGVRQKQERCPRRWPIRNHRKRHSKIQNAQFSSQQHFPRGVSPEGHNLQRLSDSLFYWFRDFLQGPVYTGPFFGRSTWKPNSGWTRRSGRASNAAHEARTRTTAHSRRPTASDAVGVALLRRLFASFAVSLRHSGNPLGPTRPAAVCALHGLRQQGCNATASPGAALMWVSCRSRPIESLLRRTVVFAFGAAACSRSPRTEHRNHRARSRRLRPYACNGCRRNRGLSPPLSNISNGRGGAWASSRQLYRR